jgi:hypothetical protein
VTVTEIFEAHVKTHKVTPGQQVNLLIFYLGLRLLLPKITLAEYLEGSLRVAGATKDNLLFPKDALDHHCPNKDSAWEPKERVELMKTYLSLVEIASQEGWLESAPPFTQFLATEAPLYKGQTAAPPAPEVPATPVLPTVVASPVPPVQPGVQVPEAPAPLVPPGMAAIPTPTAAPARGRKKVAVINWAPGMQCSYRAPNGPVLAGQIVSVINNVFTFQASSGELISGITDTNLFEALEDAPPLPPPSGSISQKMVLAPADADEFDAFLAMPSAIATRSIGEVLKTARFQLSPTLVFVIDVINAQPRPSIDAYVFRDGVVVAEVEPREMSVYGSYSVTVDTVLYQVEVSR